MLFSVICSKADMSKVKNDFGISSIYSKEDMNAAIELIKKKFSTFDGCERNTPGLGGLPAVKAGNGS